MIRQLPMHSLHADFGIGDMIPQAILNTPLSYFSTKLGVEFETDTDDLDQYEGAAVLIDDRFPIAIKQYSGYPSGTVTIYLPSETSSVEQVTRMIRMILGKFELPDEAIAWERQMEPDL